MKSKNLYDIIGSFVREWSGIAGFAAIALAGAYIGSCGDEVELHKTQVFSFQTIESGSLIIEVVGLEGPIIFPRGKVSISQQEMADITYKKTLFGNIGIYFHDKSAR